MNGEIFYATLLRLYPRRFRKRFTTEMRMLFRDCYPRTPWVSFWTDTLRDLAISLAREWVREIQRDDSTIDYTLLGDAVMVASVAGPLLLWWGWISTVVLLDLDPAAQDILWWNAAGILLVSMATLAMACLVGVLSTMAAARTGRIDTTPWSKLGNSEKSTVPFSL